MIGARSRTVPMKRVAAPREVASTAVYLISEGVGFVTGQTFSVSGGLTMS